MATGIKINDQCIQEFNNLKLSKSAKFLLFAMNEAATEVVLTTVGPKDASFDDFIAALPKEDCVYAVIDFNFSHEGRDINKIIFVNWAPETARVKRKMIYAGTKAVLKDKLVGISFEVQATDYSEVSESAVLTKALQFA